MLLKFEDIVGPGQYGPVPQGYDGFNFSNLDAIDVTGLPPSGYVNVLHSGSAVAFNDGGAPCAIISTQAFDFHGGYFAAAWSVGLKLVIKGFADGHQVGKHVYFLDQSQAQIGIDDLDGLDRLVIISRGGHDADAGDEGVGRQVAMDDLQLTLSHSAAPSAEAGWVL